MQVILKGKISWFRGSSEIPFLSLLGPMSGPTHPSLLMMLPPLVTVAPVRVARLSTDPVVSSTMDRARPPQSPTEV